MIPVTDEAYKLMHEGSVALAEIESNGMRVDVDYLHRAIKESSEQIEQIQQQLRQDKIYRTWRKRYGQKTNIGSLEQLGVVLFDVLKYTCPARTKTGRPKADEDALKTVDIDFVKSYLKMGKLKKAKGTYLKGILRETVDGFCHPSFNLHLVQTYRSSSDNPNFQNIPIRNPEISKLVRRAFIARDNHQIVEIDFSGAEICGAACYHKDPRMISYIEDKTKDLHRDMAIQCYILKKKQITKPIRYCGKSNFVFPQFYGDYYINCSANLWHSISEMDLKTADGVNLRKHLRRKGITELGKCDPEKKPRKGTFEKHIQEVEYDFWNNRFHVYNQWKKDWWQQYQELGYLKMLTGFIIEGDLRRNQAINYPIQGTTFHWLLWSLIHIVKLLRKYKMKSKIVGQIHDSIVGDVHRKEVKDYLEMCHTVITEDLPKHWRWIIVPLTVEADISPLGKSWYDKEKVEI